MAYVITEACIGCKDAACVAVCPVECIYEGARCNRCGPMLGGTPRNLCDVKVFQLQHIQIGAVCPRSEIVRAKKPEQPDRDVWP